MSRQLGQAGRTRPLVLALDVGTSSCRASLYDVQGQRVPGRSAQLPTPVRTTLDGGAEVDPDTLMDLVVQTIDGLAAQAGPELATIEAVATSTFWHSLLGLDAAGRPVTPVYLWLDSRARTAADELRQRLDERAVHARTGCVLHASYWPAKLRWLGQRQPEVFRAARRWISFGEYLGLRLFGHTWVSLSMASATGLLDQRTCAWDPELLAVSSITTDQLSPIGETKAVFAGLRPEFAGRWPELRAVPWVPALGDGACSNLGAGCASRSRLALMIGTSGALRALWRTEAVSFPWGVWCYRADHQRVVLGGALNDGGSLVAWLSQSLRLPTLPEAEAAVGALEPDAHGLTILPFWAGERSPNWADDARGAILGLRLSTTPVEVLRAALEAIALRFRQIDLVLRQVVPEAREVIATGGALLRSPVWLQILADALGRPLATSLEPEASSRGAALFALEVLGWLPAGIEALAPPIGRVYEPVSAHTARYQAAAARQARLYEGLITRSAQD